MQRAEWIARKGEVQREIGQTRRRLAQLQAHPRPDQRTIGQLETRLERLMAAEYSLRIAIDQSRP